MVCWGGGRRIRSLNRHSTDRSSLPCREESSYKEGSAWANKSEDGLVRSVGLAACVLSIAVNINCKESEAFTGCYCILAEKATFYFKHKGKKTALL